MDHITVLFILFSVIFIIIVIVRQVIQVIEKHAVDSIRKQENLEFDEWGERLRYYRCRRKCY